MRGILAERKKYDVTPALEIFDRGHITNAFALQKQGHLTLPQHAEFVLGVPGGLDATVENLVDCARALPPGSTWSVAGIGRMQLPLAVTAIAMGGHVRVGLEDNIYYSKGRLATNEELVHRIVRIATEMGRPVATPSQARKILKLPTLG
jgi:3-keto-5-aminohexanoate cleavage enzyme